MARDLVIGGANLSKLSCNPGYELELGFLCYPKCSNGYNPFLFFCVSTCQLEGTNTFNAQGEEILKNSGSDWKDEGLACRKNLYDRGIGFPTDKCAESGRQLFVGMCYKSCENGYQATTWSPTTCSQPCPDNTVEGGFANCTKINSYGRGGGNWGNGCDSGYSNIGLFCLRISFIPWEFSVRGYNCRNNCRYNPRNGLAAYGVNPNCSINFAPVGTAPNTATTINGITVSDNGCYPDPFNANQYINTGSAPQYFKGARYPIWYSNVSLRGQLIQVPNGQGEEYNTVRYEKVDENCQENWGPLCYPKCDIGFFGFGCCVCSPSCGSLADHGATCHREWYDRGVGTIPNACRDDERYYDTLLCYTYCKDNYRSFVTTCTRAGCPYASGAETPLWCMKQIKSRGNPTLATPLVTGKINSKLNLSALTSGISRIFLNSLVIVLCLVLSIFILTSQGLLKSKKYSAGAIPST